MEVAVLVFDGFDELDAIGPYEVLANAAQLGADLRVRLLTLRPADEVTPAAKAYAFVPMAPSTSGSTL